MSDAFPFALSGVASVFASGFRSIVGTAIAVRSHDPIDLESNLSEGFVKKWTVTQAHGADRVAVVTAFERQISRGDFGASPYGVLMM